MIVSELILFNVVGIVSKKVGLNSCILVLFSRLSLVVVVFEVSVRLLMF